MPSHDSEDFGGELYHDIIARLERSWGLWRDALGRVPDDSSGANRLAISLIEETVVCDEAAIERIRYLLEGGLELRNLTEHASERDSPATSLADAGRDMDREHERLLGAIEAASQASDDVLEQVRERIGGTTWRAYEDRVNRLHDHLHEQSS